MKLPPRPEKQKKEETKADEPKVNQQSTNEYFKDNSSMVDNLLSKVNNERKITIVEVVGVLLHLKVNFAEIVELNMK